MVYPEYDENRRDFRRDEREVGASVAEWPNLLPRLGWMKNLKTLSILRNGDRRIIKGMIFLKRLLHWALARTQVSGTIVVHR